MEYEKPLDIYALNMSLLTELPGNFLVRFCGLSQISVVHLFFIHRGKCVRDGKWPLIWFLTVSV
jgi:hypothetical protein